MMKNFKVTACLQDGEKGQRFNELEFWSSIGSPKAWAVVEFRKRFQTEPAWVNSRRNCWAIAAGSEGNMIIVSRLKCRFPL